ncbi:ribonuclease G [Candidatus Omnitrophus magneticus]|uniref:Ribonuclease G n=1 Tax=Candidatus Omnitrophus magneticus TaxID=1609969 RepID=A0A0F0CRD0_9BACT|nr:ribonuclease G [Candidatus Omnitrophus magneticus]
MKKDITVTNKTKECEIFVSAGPVEKRIAIVSAGKLIDFWWEREDIETYVGNIYKGKVAAIVPGIAAAFIDIGMEKKAFLQAGDVGDMDVIVFNSDGETDGKPKRPKRYHQELKISDMLKTNQEVLIQVSKESIGTKGPRVTTYLSLAGRYAVFTPFDSNVGISRRIRERSERKRIYDILRNLHLPKGTGCIVRTMSENVTEKELTEEIEYLAKLWEGIRDRAEKAVSPSVVYEEYGAVLKVLRDKLDYNVAYVMVDSPEEYKQILKFLSAFRPELSEKVKLYNGKMPLFHKFDIEKQIDAIFERKVDLKSGGSIVIEQTEGLIAIDVNTGRFTGRDNFEMTAYKTNVEAAREIPRQLILRDVGGIVVIDFIDMDQKSHREGVFNVLQEELKRDKAKISIKPISQFGLVEMTRQRMQRSLEGSSHMECPYCQGKGVIKNPETVALEGARKIERFLLSSKNKIKQLVVIAHPDVSTAFISEEARLLRNIQKKYLCKIDLKEDSKLHLSDVIVYEK